MRVDANALAAFGSEMEVQLKTLEQHIYEEAGGPFNINSPKQLGEILFGRLGLPHGKKTKTGWSTNADVLESCATRPHRGGGAGISAIREIEVHLRRGPFEGYGPGRAHPHPIPDDRHRHRAA